jgi:ferredoxin
MEAPIGIKIAIGDCLNCEALESECANEAVTQGEKRLAIGRDKCTQCTGKFESLRCAQGCHAEARVPDPTGRKSRNELLEKWYSPSRGETFVFM